MSRGSDAHICKVVVSPPTPTASPTATREERNAPPIPPHVMNASAHDIIVRSQDSNVTFPAYRARLAAASPILRKMIAAIPPGERVLDLPDEPYIVRWVLRWADCLGLFAEPPRDARVRLDALLRTACEYDMGVGMRLLRAELLTPTFLERHSLAAYSIAVWYGLDYEARVASRACLQHGCVSRDSWDTKLWQRLDQVDQDALISSRDRHASEILELMDEWLFKLAEFQCRLCCRGQRRVLADGWRRWRNAAEGEVKE